MPDQCHQYTLFAWDRLPKLLYLKKCGLLSFIHNVVGKYAAGIWKQYFS
jgi:hypothetical protein